MDDAIAKSIRRHANKHRLPRTPGDEAAYQTYRRRMKTHRIIKRLLEKYIHKIWGPEANGIFLVHDNPEFTYLVEQRNGARIRVDYIDPAVLKVFFSAPENDELREAWKSIGDALHEQTGLPVEVTEIPLGEKLPPHEPFHTT